MGNKFYHSLSDLLKDNNVLYKDNLEPLREEALKLKAYVWAELREYYNSYTPTMYRRTYGLLNSLEVDKNVRVRNNVAIMDVYFNERALGVSMFGNRGFHRTMGKATLIDKGWRVRKNVWFRKINHFGFQKGFNFINKSIKEFKNYMMANGLKLKLSRADRRRN